jgi:hypothetical protein
MYISIRNPGVAPVEGYTTLGLSTSADSTINGIIGQFGSGNKHAVNLLLRNGRKIIIYLGTKRLEFGSTIKTVHAPDGSHVYNNATITVDGETQELGYTLEFGKYDWDDVTMALREFISNAIDMTIKLNGDHQHTDLKISTCAKPKPIDECTCVYIEADDAMMEYVRDLGKFFLHFSGMDLCLKHIPQPSNTPCRMYREGVFIRELKDHSLFSYNLSDIKIDESRNLDKYKAESIITDELKEFDTDEASMVLEAVRKQDHYLETRLLEDCYGMRHTTIDAWERAVKSTFTLDDILCQANPYIVQRVIEEGYNPIPVTTDMLHVLRKQGAQTYKDILDTVSQCEFEVFDGDADDALIEIAVWEGLELFDATGGEEQPIVKYFNDPETSGSHRKLGMCKDGIVFINSCLRGDSVMLRATLVEEYVHFLSGCSDCSRGFQTFCCETISKAISLLEK